MLLRHECIIGACRQQSASHFIGHDPPQPTRLALEQAPELDPIPVANIPTSAVRRSMGVFSIDADLSWLLFKSPPYCFSCMDFG